jgi:hypothetical protein
MSHNVINVNNIFKRKRMKSGHLEKTLKDFQQKLTSVKKKLCLSVAYYSGTVFPRLLPDTTNGQKALRQDSHVDGRSCVIPSRRGHRHAMIATKARIQIWMATGKIYAFLWKRRSWKASPCLSSAVCEVYWPKDSKLSKIWLLTLVSDIRIDHKQNVRIFHRLFGFGGT